MIGSTLRPAARPRYTVCMNNRPADRLAIALAQLNPVVGDCAGNADKARRARAQAAADGGPAVLVGTPWVEDGKLYNANLLLAGGRIDAIRYKVDLPNYGVFDEKRVFVPGPMPGPIVFKGVRIGIPICEDIWGPDVVECVAESGGEILLVPNGSPYWRDKTAHRLNIAVARVVEAGLPLVYLNQVGGQDEVVFDGASFVVNADRTLGAQLPAFEECVALTHWRREAGGWRCVEGPCAALVVNPMLVDAFSTVKTSAWEVVLFPKLASPA